MFSFLPFQAGKTFVLLFTEVQTTDIHYPADTEHWPGVGSMLGQWRNVLLVLSEYAQKKHLYNIYTTSVQRLRRWPKNVQILYKCFTFAEEWLIVIVE